MCPGKAATLEEIDEICRETPFHTPFWKGKTAQTDVPERILAPAEVEVINNTYLELNAPTSLRGRGSLQVRPSLRRSITSLPRT